MDKKLIFPGNTAKERDLFLVNEDRAFLRKHASAYHPKIAAYIEKAKPLPNLVQVLLTALGAYEYWGINSNGDGFREKALAADNESFGHKTFVTNGNYFLHHVNKDPALSKGKILETVWNDKAKRVELIVGVDVNKDPDGVAAIDNGESLCFSMGCKVPYDVCSICANKAKTREHYCEHLRYLMGQIDPETNKLAFADNTLPRFFDISRVLIPADKTAYMWQKVASAAANPYKQLSSAYLAELPAGRLNDIAYLQQKVAEQQEHSKAAASKSATVRKSAAITKQVPATLPAASTDHLSRVIPAAKAALESEEPTLPPGVLAKLKEMAPTVEHILSTMLSLGIAPKAAELAALGVPANAQVAPEKIDDGVAKLLCPHLAERSYARPYLVRRIVILARRLEDEPGLAKKAADYRAPGTSKAPAALIAGTAAALYALLGHKFIEAHPLFSMALGVTALATLNSTSGKSTAGFFDVDPKGGGAYNNTWQRSLAYSQAHPVTVIKTGASRSNLVKKAFHGLPTLFLSHDPGTGSLSHFVANHPHILDSGITEALVGNKPISELVKNAVQGGERIFKEASLQNLEFLSAVPEEHQALFWDLAILDSANRIQKKLGG